MEACDEVVEKLYNNKQMTVGQLRRALGDELKGKGLLVNLARFDLIFDLLDEGGRRILIPAELLKTLDDVPLLAMLGSIANIGEITFNDPIEYDEDLGIRVKETRGYTGTTGIVIREITDDDSWLSEDGEINNCRFVGPSPPRLHLSGTIVSGVQLTSILGEIFGREGINIEYIGENKIELNDNLIKTLSNYGIRQGQDLLFIRDLIYERGQDINDVLSAAFRITLSGNTLTNVMQAYLDVKNAQEMDMDLFDEFGNCRSVSLEYTIYEAFQNIIQKEGALKSLRFLLNSIEEIKNAGTTEASITYETYIGGPGRKSHIADAIIDIITQSYLYEAKLRSDPQDFILSFLGNPHFGKLNAFGKTVFEEISWSIKSRKGVFMSTNFECFQELLTRLGSTGKSDFQTIMARGWNLQDANILSSGGEGNQQYIWIQGNLQLSSSKTLYNFNVFVVSGEDMTIPNLAPVVTGSLSTLLVGTNGVAHPDLNVENFLNVIYQR